MCVLVSILMLYLGIIIGGISVFIVIALAVREGI
jgi:hypothetical protein